MFPREKPYVTTGAKTLLAFRNCIQPIWREARRLVAQATEIYAVGYRFAPIDRKDVLGLLSVANNCKRLVIQNRPGTAEEICEKLRRKWLEPEGIALKPEAFPQPF